eukprot:CAMPEP_0171058522 /NCGR_PEP_ID=MMETSP0766_2-20121228/2542_1 /TAXON_ID=439317 /ORGANISM="Gambierdiscus australes, Strain CAWD 149" /LENGTH=198 /DNA_ID=CAMNT_0011513807 /DNA_START=688 /DNA_END=1281 /DNA_ORIENTATION=-
MQEPVRMQVIKAPEHLRAHVCQHTRGEDFDMILQLRQAPKIHKLKHQVHAAIGMRRETRVPLHQVWAALGLDECPHLVQQLLPIVAVADLQRLQCDARACGLDAALPHTAARALANRGILFKLDILGRELVLSAIALDTVAWGKSHPRRLVHHGTAQTVVGPAPRHERLIDVILVECWRPWTTGRHGSELSRNPAKDS